MNKIAYLFDECMPTSLFKGLRKAEPSIDVRRVGDADAPASGTKDPENLRFAEANGLTLISRDKRTLSTHIANHLDAGGHTWGVRLIREKFPVEEIVEELILIWLCLSPQEFVDSKDYIPKGSR